MGYDAKIKITKELDSKWKPWIKEEQDADMYKTILICDAMKKYDQSIPLIYKQLSFSIKLYFSTIEQNWKINLQKELENNDNTYSVCGWSYANETEYFTLEEYQNKVLNNLILLCIVDAPSPFSKGEEKERYWEKLDQVQEIVDEIEGMIWDILSHSFYEEYLEEDKSNLEESY